MDLTTTNVLLMAREAADGADAGVRSALAWLRRRFRKAAG